MSEAETLRRDVRAIAPEDALAIARSLIDREAVWVCCWSASAVETVAAIILWEAYKDHAP
jgi:hypothetical protein